MNPSVEISIDLTTQELLDPPAVDTLAATGLVEVEDIGDIDPLLQTGSFVANGEATAVVEDGMKSRSS